MAQLTFILGKSGTGKSTSLRNFKKEDGIGYITATGKALPFKTDVPQMHAKSYPDLLNAIAKSKAEVMVIDDFNYFMSFEEFEKIGVTGYAKFGQMAQNVVSVINAITKKDGNQRFYIMAHSEDSEEGLLKLKTTGKMVTEKFVPEGLTNQVIETALIDGEFVFKVKTDGRGIKTPLGMMDTETLPNDLKELDHKIKEFYK